MGSRFTEGRGHVLDETSFSFVNEDFPEVDDNGLIDAMSGAAGSQDLDPDLRSQFSYDGPDEILKGLGIEFF